MFLNAWGVGYADKPVLDVVSPFLRDDTDIACANLVGNAPAVPWPVPANRDAAIDAVLKAQADGFDAVVHTCAGDPFLQDLQGAVSIPVVGVAETVLRNARVRGKIGIMDRQLPAVYDAIIPSNAQTGHWDTKAQNYGLTPDLYSVRKVRVPSHPDPQSLDVKTPDEARALSERMYESFFESLHDDGIAQVKAAVAEDGIEAVYFACNFWSQPIAALGTRAHEFGVPIINPLGSAATYAEHLALSSV
jgi:allantoin racemase